MKLFVVLCIFVTIAWVSAESDPQEAYNELTDQLKRTLKREATDNYIMGPANDASEVSRERRAAKNPCDTNWFKRMMNLDSFACNVRCSGQRWRGGKCYNRNCVCF
ncbi:defensin-2-like [Halictus rubicundus]|uniref:defensin-2-like n=1 Tax=Halictus rubicundus TaxID=77578 RepID=UPI004036D29A